MHRITTALLLLSPAIASAQCLTADAMDGGITVSYLSGDVSHIQRQADGSLLDAFTKNSGYYQETILFESWDGVVETGWTTHEPNTWEVRDSKSKTYDFAPDSLAPYTAGMRSLGTVTWAGSRYDSGEKQYLVTGYESEPLVIGECSYDAVRVFVYETSLPDGDFNIREIKFLPALGVGVQVGNSYFAFSPEDAEILDITAN